MDLVQCIIARQTPVKQLGNTIYYRTIVWVLIRFSLLYIVIWAFRRLYYLILAELLKVKVLFLLSDAPFNFVEISLDSKGGVATSDDEDVAEDMLDKSCVVSDDSDDCVENGVEITVCVLSKAVDGTVAVSPSTGHDGRLTVCCGDIVTADSPQESVTFPVGFFP